MADRTSPLFLCLVFAATLGFLSGCGHKYEDQETGITIRELGSDLDNHWAFKGVVVESVKSGSPADELIDAGELISYIVDERQVTDKKGYRKAFSEALEEDEKAMLRMLKVVPATTSEELGIRTRPDPEERGVIVDSVKPGSKAEEAGIKRGAIIYEIDGKSTKSVDEYNRVLAEALAADPGKLKFSVAREIVASKLSKVGIEEVEDYDSGVKVTKMKESKTEGTPASMEGIREGDVITHVIDEMKITDIDSYKKAIKKAADADRVIFKRGELGGVKLVAIDALGQIGDVRAVAPLLKSLESEDKWIRRAAARALEKMNDKRVIQPLMKHLLEENEPDAEVRRSSARALARMRPVEAIESLAQALKDPSLGVRLEAGYALGRIGEHAIDVLIKARHDADSRVRDSAVAALGNIGRLVKLLFSIGSGYQIDLDNEKIPEDLRQEFENNGISLSQNATVSIEKKGSDWLITDKDNKKTYFVRRGEDKLNIHLVKKEKELISVRDELISVLRDANEESTVKLTAIQALNKIGDPESIAELRRVEVGETEDPGLRAFVTELLPE